MEDYVNKLAQQLANQRKNLGSQNTKVGVGMQWREI